MTGVSEGIFAPDKPLSGAECAVLALRLYDIQRGGDGIFEQAPEDWGMFTLTTADGTEISGYAKDPFMYYSFIRDGNAAANLCFYVEPEREEWGKAQDAHAATVAVNGRVFSGVAQYWDPDNDGKNWVLSFCPDNSGDRGLLRDIFYSSHRGTAWYLDAWYYAVQNGLTDVLPGFYAWSYDASRDFFAYTMAAVTDLPALREVITIPGVSREEQSYVYALYEAGIFTGIDGYGTFGGDMPLTRAEAAVAVARVLDENQRIGAPPLPFA